MRESFTRVPLQCLTQSACVARKYFRVLLQEEDRSEVAHSDVLKGLRRELGDALCQAGSQDRELRRHEVWVTRFGFAEHVRGRSDFGVLCGLVELPGVSDALRRVLKAVVDLDREACELLDSTSVLVRRRLATAVPER